MTPYSQTIARRIYTIKIGSEVVGTTIQGDIFISDLQIDEDENFHLVAFDLARIPTRCWLLTDENDIRHTFLATSSNFTCLGPGVWIHEPIVI